VVSELPAAEKGFRQPVKTLLKKGEDNERKKYPGIYVFNGVYVSLVCCFRS